ncbi:hypothetical protein BDR06DRAFT_875116, partial [Suillus hirtellus]
VDEIVQKFLFFPILHCILSSHPNITPIAITTGVGPHGKKTLHYQAPSNSEKDDSAPPFTPVQHQQMQSLHDILTAAAPTIPEQPPSFEQFLVDDTWGNDPLLSLPIATPARHPPKSSTLAQDILDRAKQHITKILKK